MKRIAILLGAAALLPACGSGSSEGPPPPMPDFSLVDDNSNSASFGTPISPRDSLTYVSAWYFGHAT